ncbi:MAG: LacI family DNA-binding transcriptional regulator [Rubellimicrobium sp.]|nr:LacI family DNA-binding transcriptional regulator [Rubellimicrobium sp.]
MNRARPTLRTICAMTGLSVATVSKALRGSDQVRPETRARIEEAARRIGYRHNLSGLRLRTGKTYQIAAVMGVPGADGDEWEGVEYTQLLAGLSKAMAHTPYRPVFYGVQHREEGLAVIRGLVERGEADGIVLAGLREDDPRLAFLDGRDFPFVTYGTTEGARHPFVDTDNARTVEVAVTRLAGRGHRRIALINPPDVLSYARTRVRAWERTMAALGLPADPVLVRAGALTPGFGAGAVRGLARLDDPPTAYLCANEATALGALSAFAELGLVHGRDAVVNATDDLNISAYFIPPITTFFLPISRPARILGEFMLARLDGAPHDALQTLLMPDLIERSDDILRNS